MSLAQEVEELLDTLAALLELHVAVQLLVLLLYVGDEHSLGEVLENLEELLVEVRDDKLTQESPLVTVDEEDSPDDCRDHVNVEEYYDVVPILIDLALVGNVEV